MFNPDGVGWLWVGFLPRAMPWATDIKPLQGLEEKNKDIGDGQDPPE